MGHTGRIQWKFTGLSPDSQSLLQTAIPTAHIGEILHSKADKKQREMKEEASRINEMIMHIFP